MKASAFKSKLLAIFIKPVLGLYEQELIPLFSNISKPAFQSKVEANDENPLQNYDWALLYLDEDKLYETSKFDFLKALIPQFDWSTLPPDEIDDELAEEKLIFVKSNIHMRLEGSGDTILDDMNIDEDLFIKTSIAQFYNSLSIIQNKKHINDLLVEFMDNGNELSLVKAVKVDPSILDLQEVKDKINAIEPIKRNKLEAKIQAAKSLPNLTPDKRNKYLMLSLFLDVTARFGFLSDPYPIPNKALQNIATQHNLIPVDFDEDEFRKITSYYRK